MLRTWKVDGGTLHSLAVHRPTSRVAIGSLDGAVRVFRLADGRREAVFDGHHELVQAVAFQPSGEVLASGSGDRSVRLWSLASGTGFSVLAGHENAVQGLAFDPTGEQLVSTSSDQTALVFGTNQEPGITRLEAHYRLGVVAFSPDSQTVAAGTDSYVVHLWNADQARGLASLRGHRDRIEDLAWSPDGSLLVSASADDTLRVWRPDEYQSRLVLSGHGDDVSGVEVGPGGRRAVSISRDGTVRAWDLEQGVELALLHEGPQVFECMAWSPADSSLIVAGTRAGEIVVVDAERPGSSEVRSLLDVPITRLAFSPTEPILAVGAEDGTTRMLDTGSWKELQRFEHGDAVRGCAFTPDGSRFITTSDDRTLVVRDRVGNVMARFQLPSKPTGLALAPNGERLASIHFDAHLRLWENDGPRSLEPTRLPLREDSARIEPLVLQLFQEHVRNIDVLKEIERNEELDPAERVLARDLARWHVADPGILGGEALGLVLRSNTREKYEIARRKMDVAVEEQPNNTRWKTLLGAAHARLDDPKAALEWIPNHEALRDPSRLCRVVGLALRLKSLSDLGMQEEAQACASTLRDFMDKHIDLQEDEDIQNLMYEAESWLAKAERP